MFIFHSPQCLKLRYKRSKVRLQNIQFDNSKMSGNITDMQKWHNHSVKILCPKNHQTLFDSCNYNMTVKYTKIVN